MQNRVRLIALVAIACLTGGAAFAQNVIYDGTGQLDSRDARYDGRYVEWTRLSVETGDSLSLSAVSLTFRPEILIRVDGQERSLTATQYDDDYYYDDYSYGGSAGPVSASFIVPQASRVEVGVVADTVESTGGRYLLRVVADTVAPISFGEQQGEWSPEDSRHPNRGFVDWYMLDPGRAGLVTIEILSQVDSYLIVREGETERYDDDSGRDSNGLLSFVTDGTPFVVGVTTYSAGTMGPYTLVSSLGEVRRLSVGEETRGTVGGSEPTANTYVFTAPRTGEYMIAAWANAYEMELTVGAGMESEWGRTLGENAWGVLVNLEQGESREVRVATYGAGQADYTATVSQIQIARALRPGEIYRGSLSSNAGFYTPTVLTLTGNEGDLVRVDIETEGFEAEVYLKDEHGNEFYFSSYDYYETESPLTGIYALTTNEPIRVEIWSDYSGGTGPFTISFDDVSTEFTVRQTEPDERLQPGDEIYTTISGDEPQVDGYTADTYTILLEEGLAAEITLVSEAFDSYLEVAGPDGFYSSDDDGAGNLDSLLMFTAPASGIYTITARSLGGYEGGLYVISYEVGEPGITLLDVTGELAEGDEEDSGTYRDTISFRGVQGQEIIIELRSDFFDTKLYLYNSDNGEVAYNDDGGDGTNSRIRYTIPADGLYRIVATSYGSGSTGSYHLLVTE